MELLSIIGSIATFLLALVFGWISLTLLFETLYDMASGYFIVEDLVGGVIGLLLSLGMFMLVFGV